MTKVEINIVPGERKKLILILNEKHCRELIFLCLFRKGKFGYKVQRDMKLSPVKYFNQTNICLISRLSILCIICNLTIEISKSN